MRVTIINAVYPPEPVVSAQIGRDLAIHLKQSGTRTTVLCPYPSRPLGVEYADYRSHSDDRVDQENGVEVVRLPSFTAPRSKLFARMRESFSFGRQACRYLGHHLGDTDVVYANTWPLASQAMIARYCSRHGVPLALHIQDVYPESLLRKLPRPCRWAAAGPLTALDRWIAQQAAQVVVISENMRRTYLEGRGLPSEKVVTIRNWQDEEVFEPMPARGDACNRYKVPEEPFTFLYLGNIGPVAGVDLLIRAFHAAQLPQAQLVIAGDGSAKAACVELAKSLGARQIRFISDPEAGNTPWLLSLGHVCLLPVRKGAGMSSIPSKLMAYLFSAKPVLASVDGESDTARCVREAQCGWAGEPEQLEWLAAKMAEISKFPSTCLDEMGQRGRAYGLRHFSKAEGVKRLSSIILAAGRRAPHCG